MCATRKEGQAVLFIAQKNYKSHVPRMNKSYWIRCSLLLFLLLHSDRSSLLLSSAFQMMNHSAKEPSAIIVTVNCLRGGGRPSPVPPKQQRQWTERFSWRIKAVAADEVGKEVGTKEAALASVQKCYRAIFAAAAVEVAKEFHLQFSRESSLAILSVIWKLKMGTSLYRVSKIAFQDHKDDTSSAVERLFRIMIPLWRQAAYMITLNNAVDLFSAFGNPYTWAKLGFAAVVVSTAVVSRSISAKQVEAFAASPTTLKIRNKSDAAAINHKPGVIPQQSKLKILLRNMALCTGALLLRGCLVMPLLVLAQPTLKARLLRLPHVLTPTLTGLLLWQLRRSLMETLHPLLVGEVQEVTDLKFSGKHYRAQTEFYDRVAETFGSEVVLAVIFSLITFLRSL